MKLQILPSRGKKSTWVELPKSKFGIKYVLGDFPSNEPPRVTATKGAPILWMNSRKKPSKLSPFERMLLDLDEVTRREGHADGTALMYIREIFEPGDSEYDYIGDYVCASQLSQEQVDRLRIMVLPKRREEILVSYLHQFKEKSTDDLYKNITFNDQSVFEYFDSFHLQYLAIDDPKLKFDVLFGFSFALKHRSEWIFQYENQRRREKMIESLGRHWRYLHGRHTAEELGTLYFV